MQIREPGGIAAWLTITRSQGEFGANISDLLRQLVPTVRGVLQLFVARERERHSAALSADAVRRLQFGWITLGAEGEVLECDEQAALVLTQSRDLLQGLDGKLSARSKDVNAAVASAVRTIAGNSASRPRAITVSQDPWLDMLIVPARRKTATTHTPPL
ncbi:MAG: hypothetical protein ACKOVA_14375 [Novosphingobium sp.]